MYLLGIRRTTNSRRKYAARKPAASRQPEELAYDAMLTDEGRGMLYVPFLNYADGNLDAVHEMRASPAPYLGRRRRALRHHLRRQLPDLSLTHWTRDRSRGENSRSRSWWRRSRARPRLGRPYDRGVIAPGFKADVNVIDYDKLHLHPPKVHYDLPVGGRRLMQQVDGYDATIVSGVVTQRGGKATGARRAGWCGERRVQSRNWTRRRA